jgi:hypothetical protein
LAIVLECSHGCLLEKVVALVARLFGRSVQRRRIRLEKVYHLLTHVVWNLNELIFPRCVGEGNGVDDRLKFREHIIGWAMRGAALGADVESPIDGGPQG